jgi:hypothetical protein
LFNCTVACLCLASPVAPADSPQRDHALTLYSGKLTDNNWYESLMPGVDLVDSNLAALAWSQVIHRSPDEPWSLEWEANVAKHWGLQNHWEFNLALAGRWHRFPWNDKVRTSAAYGVGPSYATEVPQYEMISGEKGRKWLAFWYLELTLSPPGSEWSGILRLHHRSDAFGQLGKVESSDILTLGVRYAY